MEFIRICDWKKNWIWESLCLHQSGDGLLGMYGKRDGETVNIQTTTAQQGNKSDISGMKKYNLWNLYDTFYCLDFWFFAPGFN